MSRPDSFLNDSTGSLLVAIFSPYATVAPHFETELEIAQQHLDRGDTVEMVSCFGDLANCDFNQTHDAARCEDCVGRREMGSEFLEQGQGRLSLVQLGSTSQTQCEPIQIRRTKFKSVEDLTSYTVDGFDIGYAGLSSLVSICRDPEPDFIAYETLLADFMNSAWQTYQFTLNYIAQNSPDRIYVFNGRFAAMRAVLRACQKLKVDCWLHERGCDLNHFDFTKNHLIHEIERTDRVIRECWESNSNNDRASIGKSWFQDRVDRVEKNWHSFVKDQEAGRLPDNWNHDARNVTIFCSSDDEFVAIGDCWTNALYPNQVTAIARIAADLLKHSPQTRLYLRVHPNLRNVDNQRKRDMLSLNFSNLTLIAPDAKIDSYELLRASNTVVSFGSSVGIEAVFWGRPSVLLGPCLYQHLGGTHQPKTHVETIEMLGRDLPALEKNGALMYGHWFQVRGYRYQYFEAASLFEGKFKGEILYNRPKKKPSLAKRMVNALRGNPSGKQSN